MKVKSLSPVRLFGTSWTLACQAPLSLGFSRQEYWSGMAFPSPGDLPNPGIEPGSPSLQADALPLGHQGEYEGGTYFSHCPFSSSSFPCICRLCRKSACSYVGPSYTMCSVLWVKVSVSIPIPHCFNCYNPISYFYWDICTIKFALLNIKFDIFPKLSNYNHCLILDHFHHLQKKPPSQ